ncbi:MAG: DNA polymerase III subunit delta' [Clostridium butyricum]|nr:DNA polymerase III subunit delta' [Clostridium butyricum]
MRKIIGHEIIKEAINKRNINGSFSHANLLVGNDGIGKSIIAQYLASKILKGLDYINSVDIIKYYPSSNSFGVDDVRTIIEEVNKKPYEGNKKVIIMYRCEKMTAQAQNALLKTIEEPPEGVSLILLSDSLETILETIQSRCQIYKLTPLSKEEILEYLEECYSGLSIEEKQAALAYSMGIPGKADRFIQDEKLKQLRDLCIDLFQDILAKNKNIVIKYQELLNNLKDEKYDLLDIMILYIRDLSILKEINNKDRIINLDKIEKLEIISRQISYKKLSSMLEYIKEARINFNSNSNYSMTVSVLLMGFVEV